MSLKVELTAVFAPCLFLILCGPLGATGAVVASAAAVVVCWSATWAVQKVGAALSRHRELSGSDPVSLLAVEVRNIAAVVEALAALSAQQAPLLTEMHSAFKVAQQARQSR